MGLFTGKRGIVMGIANDHSIAWAITQFLHQEGAELGFSHLPDKEGRNRNESRLRKLTDPLEPKLVSACDVACDESMGSFFDSAKKTYGAIDFLVHSIAFADVADIKGPTLKCSRAGFKLAMDISCYSLIATSRLASEMMTSGGSILAMTYYGGEKVVDGYNMMGVCKSALDMSVRYLAYDLGEKNIRVNALSAGPMRTLAASAVGEFKEMMQLYEKGSPLGRNITSDEVAKAGGFLLSDWSSATTGEIFHVDCGYNIMGSPHRRVKEGLAAAASNVHRT